MQDEHTVCPHVEHKSRRRSVVNPRQHNLHDVAVQSTCFEVANGGANSPTPPFEVAGGVSTGIDVGHSEVSYLPVSLRLFMPTKAPTLST